MTTGNSSGHYAREPEYYRERNKRRRSAVLAEVRKIKEESPCMDCGNKFPYYVMQFDHIGSDKSDNIATMAQHTTLPRVMREIEKCELVCSNCHAKRTYQRSLAD